MGEIEDNPRMLSAQLVTKRVVRNSLGVRFCVLLPLVFFFASALIGALIAYNPTNAWLRFGLIAGGVIICFLFANLPEWIETGNQVEFAWMQVTLTLLPLAVLIYFGLTNDWTSRIGKIAWLDPLLTWLASWQPRLSGARLDSNSLGGALAMLMPLQIAALVHSRGTKQIAPSVLLIGVSVFGLFLSESRGAWLALSIAAWLVGMWMLVGGITRRYRRSIWFALIALTALVFAIVFATTSLGTTVVNARSDRWEVWRNSLDLAGDYPFTGLGLGGFAMAYSSYVLLVHVPHTIHAHNLFLDIWLEQGLLGFAAFAGLIAASIVNSSDSRWRIAALTSVSVIVLHGFLDDAFYGYGGIAIPLLFVPLGIVARQPGDNESKMCAINARPLHISLAIGTTAICLLVALAIQPGFKAAWIANLGALSQTRAELSIYSWPQWSIQDQVRRSNRADLDFAIAAYKTALASDPHSVVANRRLGQIGLSLGEYVDAKQRLDAAYAVAPDQRATRQMLGEANAISGNIGCAAMLWDGIDVSADQLKIREWWYGHIGDRERAELMKQAASIVGQVEDEQC